MTAPGWREQAWQAFREYPGTGRDALAAALDAAEPLIRADADSRRIPGSELYMAGAAAERERIRQQIDPAELRKLADWFDTDDEFKTVMFPETWSERGHELQDWLRASADLIAGFGLTRTEAARVVASVNGHVPDATESAGGGDR